jgi:hypothetical protein
MSKSLTPYLAQVCQELERSIKNMELQEPEKCQSYNQEEANEYPIRPMVELGGLVESCRIQHSAREYCLFESSKNSIRLSFAFKQQCSDAIDQTVLEKYMRFFQQRAPVYEILRRKPVECISKEESKIPSHDHQPSQARPSSYSISFLITGGHVQNYGKTTLVATVLDFLGQVDKECSHVKISINARARFVAADFLKSF